MPATRRTADGFRYDESGRKFKLHREESHENRYDDCNSRTPPDAKSENQIIVIKIKKSRV